MVGAVLPGSLQVPQITAYIYPDYLTAPLGVHLTAGFERLNQAILRFVTALEEIPSSRYDIQGEAYDQSQL